MKLAFFVEGRNSLGHISRALELERRLLLLDSSIETVFFLNSPFIEPFSGKNVHLIDVPDKGSKGGELLADYSEVIPLVRLIQPDALIFDTLFPRSIVESFPEIPKALILRKYRERELLSFIELKKYSLFDRILIPHLPSTFPLAGEIENAVFIKPIVRPIPSTPGGKGILVMCGGGGFPDAEKLISLIGNAKIDADIITGPFFKGNMLTGSIRYDPLLPERLGKAKLVISAAGYNAVNEIIAAHVPSLLIPGARNNDDQEERAERLVAAGGAALYDPHKDVSLQIKELLHPKKQRMMRDALWRLDIASGFQDAASIIHHLAQQRDFRLIVGSRCNNHCVYCDEISMKGKDKDLSMLISEITHAKAAGYNRIILPCNADSRKDFTAILTAIRINGMRAVLHSNGRMFSYPAFCAKTAPLLSLVRINVAGRSTHEQVTRTDSYNQTRSGIANLVAAGVKTVCILTVTRANANSLRDEYSESLSLGTPVMINYPIGSAVRMDDSVEQVAGLPSFGIMYNPHLTQIDLNEETAEVQYLFEPDLRLEQCAEKTAIDVSIIIPTYNREALLEPTLRSLFSQDVSPSGYEIIIIDDGGDDQTLKMVRSLDSPCKLTYIHWPRNRPYVFGDPGNRAGPARNIGIRHAIGDKIIFWDSDMIASPDMISSHLASFDKEACSLGIRKFLKQGVTHGFPYTDEDLDEPIRISRMIDRRNHKVMDFIAPWFFLASNNVMISKERLYRVGLFDKHFVYWGTEDQELGYRLIASTMTFTVVKEAIGYHQFHPQESLDFDYERYITRIHKELFYKKFLARELYDFHSHIFEQRRSPYHQSIIINLTGECNLSCDMCFDHGEAHKPPLGYDTLTKTMVDLMSLGYEMVNFSGGEPTLHPDFSRIIGFASDIGMIYSVSTNGTFDDGIMDSLIKYPPSKIIFSLDGDEELHDLLRGVKGTYARCVENIRKAVGAGIDVAVQCVMHSKSHHKIPSIERLAQTLGASGFLVQAYHPGTKKTSDDPFWPKQADLAAMDTTVDRLITSREKKGFIINTPEYLRRLKGYFRGHDLHELGLRCLAMNRFGIDSDGSVKPCWGKPWDLGNVTSQDLRSIVFSERFRQARKSMQECSTPCLLNCYDHSRSSEGISLDDGMDGGRAISKPYHRFRRELAYHLSEKIGEPLIGPDTIQIAVTHKCNLQCTFCDVSKDTSSEDLPFDTVRDLITQYEEIGGRNVFFVGGEPFLRKDIYDMISLVRSLGMQSIITTNGTLITKERSKRIIDSHLDILAFSLDSIDRDIHDRSRGKGVFDRCMKGIDHMMAANSSIQMGVLSIIMRSTIDHLAGLIDFAEKKGFSFINFQPIQTDNTCMSQKDMTHPEWIAGDDLLRLEKALRRIDALKESRKIRIICDTQGIPHYFRNQTQYAHAACCQNYVRLFVKPGGMLWTCTGIKEHYASRGLRAFWESAEMAKERAFAKRCKSKCLQRCMYAGHSNTLQEAVRRFLSQDPGSEEIRDALVMLAPHVQDDEVRRAVSLLKKKRSNNMR